MNRGIATAAILAFATIFSAPAGGQVFDVPGRYLDVVFAASDVVEVENIQYGRAVDSEGNWQDLLLDVHYVPGDGAAWRPAIVWVHGGGFIGGSKDGYQSTITEFARSGYAVFSIDYRLQGEDAPELQSPERRLGALTGERLQRITQARHDAQAAIRWVRLHAEEYLVDPNRVAVAGHSAGGTTTTAVAFNADDDPGNSGSPGASSIPNAAVSMSGGGLPFFELRIDPGDPPIQFVHGLLDEQVFYPAALAPCTVTVAVGNICEHVMDPDQGHGAFGHAEIRAFLYRHIIEGPGLITPTDVQIVGVPGLE